MSEAEPYTVREAVPDDAPAVAALVAACEDEWRVSRARRTATTSRWFASPVDFVSAGGRAHVAVANGNIVGFVAGAQDADPSGATIEDLFVARGARRVGIGSRLVAILEQAAAHDGKRFIDAWCDERLVDGARFFDRRGYTTDGRLVTADPTNAALVRAYRRRL